MADSLMYTVVPQVDETPFETFAMDVTTMTLGWRFGMESAATGPTVGFHPTSDVVVDLRVVLGAISLVVPADSLWGNGGADEPPAAGPWAWCRRALRGAETGEEAALVMSAVEPGFDRGPALAAIDEVAAAVISWWLREEGGPAAIVSSMVARESERRTAERKLDGMRRRSDRDLLVLADQLARERIVR